MSSYAVSARIATTRPHLRAPDPGLTDAIPRRASSDVPDASEELPVLVTRLPAIDSLDEDPSTWLERMAVGWGQMTWYLFNPEGWR